MATPGALPPVTQLVAVGASAGGVEALSTLVATLPPDFPAPLVLAQHLDPERPSYLQSILARRSTLPVRTVIDHEALEPGVVYVVPANRHIALDDHHLSIEQDGPDRPKPSIDRLFGSAAAVFGEGLIAVVLSGLGSDGAAGARRVKEAGGTVVIQNPRTAPYPSMPEALAPTTVDVVAEVEALGPLLHDLLTGAYTPRGPREDRQLRAFLSELHDRSGIDFARYKEPTIQRRLQRRLLATGMRSLEQYRAYLERQPQEYDRLVNAFLIKVTEFFRDADLFAHLRATVLPALVAEARARATEGTPTLRLWSAGCATGEEAYSLALLVAEALGEELGEWTVRIFATDLDGEAVDFARRGVYPASALEGVPLELVARYLVAEESGGAYAVSKAVRGLLVFGEHDLGQRPPFPQIDLCLCRNVLIYFTPDLQRRALELFAFALRDGGYLALGKAETTSPLPDYFAPVESALRLYQRRGERLVLPGRAERPEAGRGRRGRPGSGGGEGPSPAARELARVRAEAQRAQQGQLAAEQLLLELPVGVAVVDRRYDLQRLNGRARRLLGIRGEALGEDVMHQLRGLRPEDERALRAALDAALGGTERTLEAVASTTAAPGQMRYLRLTCHPVGAVAAAHTHATGEAGAPVRPTASTSLAVLLVSDVTADEEARRADEEARRADAARVAAAEAEAGRLTQVVTDLQETIRALQEANEALAAANTLLRRANEEYVLGNEEVQAAAEEVETLNEELQATNEELETLNEEQQATNEELETTNEELRARHFETEVLAATVETQRRRLAAILDSLGEAVVALDGAGHVVFGNAPLAQMFGMSSSMDADQAFVARDGGGRPLPREETPQERARRGETFHMEFTTEGPAGRPGTAGTGTERRRWYEAIGRPIRDDTSAGAAEGSDAGDTGEGSVLVIRDITDRTLRQLQEEFVAVASHELRTPLTPISGYLDMLAKRLENTRAGEPVDTEKVAGYARAAQVEVRRLRRLVDDLLDAGRLAGGRLHLQRAPTNLRAVVTQAVEVARLLAAERPLQLDAGDALHLLVDGDAARLEQVVRNLLSNALTHAPGATITVRLRQENGQAVLEVRDDGPGIDPAAQPHLFERFYQAARDRPGQPAAQGLGLGLYIAREIVEAHGGTIAVASTPGAGATFTVRLPLLPEGMARTAAGTAAPSGGRETETEGGQAHGRDTGADGKGGASGGGRRRRKRR